MFNYLFIYLLFICALLIVFCFFFIKIKQLFILITELFFISIYVLCVYLGSVLDDPRLFLLAILVLFLASIELVFFLFYFFKKE